MIDNNIKLYIILLLIFYIFLTICIYRFFCCNNKKKENFIGFLEMVSSITETNTEKEKDIIENTEDIKVDNEIITNNQKKLKKYIYISKINYNSSIIKYNFYNKDDDLYLYTTIYNDNNSMCYNHMILIQCDIIMII